jgi:hypothetical protein
MGLYTYARRRIITGKMPLDGGRNSMAQDGESPLSIYRVGDAKVNSADVIFVHGLMGSAAQSWAPSGVKGASWLNWLSEQYNVFVLDYPAELFWWSSSGASMALPERARSVIDLLASYDLGRKPTVFIVHSLGGLLVKALLRAAHDLNDSDWKRLLANTRGVVFLGTPHTGAGLGVLADALRLFGVSSNATQLKANEAYLLDLTAWYSRNARRLGIRTLSYYEKERTKGLIVVDAGSADPRVEDCNPIPCDANHQDICKPRTRTDPVYLGVLRFVESLLPTLAQAANEIDESGAVSQSTALSQAQDLLHALYLRDDALTYPVLSADRVNEVGRLMNISEVDVLRLVSALREDGLISLRWEGQVSLTTLGRQYLARQSAN